MESEENPIFLLLLSNTPVLGVVVAVNISYIGQIDIFKIIPIR